MTRIALLIGVFGFVSAPALAQTPPVPPAPPAPSAPRAPRPLVAPRLPDHGALEDVLRAAREAVRVDVDAIRHVEDQARHAMDQALTKARSGSGPTLIEALTYRLSDHTTADDATRYRSPDEVAEAWKLEPILRLRAHLVESGAWDKAQEDKLLKECNEQVQAAAQAYLDTPHPTAENMFDHLYATLPAALAAQRSAATGHGPDHAG